MQATLGGLCPTVGRAVDTERSCVRTQLLQGLEPLTSV